MIERLVDDSQFQPRAIWLVTITAACPRCKSDMQPNPEAVELACTQCDYACTLEKSLDDIADDVLSHVHRGRAMDTSRIREKAETETDIQKREAGDD
jgi:hypothetical protein